MIANKRNIGLGDVIRKARVAAQLTQEDLADRSGLDRSYIGGIERGERNPTFSVIEKIAAGLGISLAELFSSYSRQVSEDERA
jgi:transcriptional regulator with XRE-family HTH domain